MKIGQYDIFGNLVPVEKTIKEKPSKKFKTMQEMFGFTKGKFCKTCRHKFKREYAGTYYKCEKWHTSNSSATDIRLRDPACGLYEEI